MRFLFKSPKLSLAGKAAVCTPIPRDLPRESDPVHGPLGPARRFLRARSPKGREEAVRTRGIAQ